jgi:hypothetical protein
MFLDAFKSQIEIKYDIRAPTKGANTIKRIIIETPEGTPPSSLLYTN